jgi:hypothetical protein
MSKTRIDELACTPQFADGYPIDATVWTRTVHTGDARYGRCSWRSWSQKTLASTMRVRHTLGRKNNADKTDNI